MMQVNGGAEFMQQWVFGKKMQGEQSAIIAAFRASGMQVARFRYRRDAVAALEALCAAVEIESV